MSAIKLGRCQLCFDELLQDAVHNIAASAAARSVQISIRVPASLSRLFAEKELMRIALDNLLDNAVRYSQHGGRIMVEAAESASELRISVTDEGMRIEPVDLPHVFARFARNNPSGQRRPNGLGLGLYLANEIITLHGGRITLVSTPEAGNVFTVHLNKQVLSAAPAITDTLPLMVSEASAESVLPVRRESAPFKRLKG